MKKFKLIAAYPGSPKLGDIWNEETDFVGIINDGKQEQLVRSHITKFPEFWQEIIEKDYEILSIIGNSDNRENKGRILSDKENIDAWVNGNAAHLWNIHSIKRLSDSEIFTIGDKAFIPSFGKIIAIDKIFIFKDDNTIRFSGESDQRSFNNYHLKDMIKAKQLLFTTEDGVDVFENQVYSYVNYLMTIRSDVRANSNHTIKEGMKAFSTKEKAEEYVLYNKPCLSLNEVSNFRTLNKTKINLINDLKNLVKSKLNQ